MVRKLAVLGVFVGLTAMVGCVLPPPPSFEVTSPYEFTLVPKVVAPGSPGPTKDIYACSLAGGPVTVSLLTYDDPYETAAEIYAVVYQRGIDQLGNPETIFYTEPEGEAFEGPGHSVVSDPVPASACFWVGVWTGLEYSPVLPPETNNLAAPGGDMVITW